MRIWDCIFVEQIPFGNRTLRRSYGFAENVCPTHKYGHNATVDIEPGPGELQDGMMDGVWACVKDDPRWPTHCDCGFEFTVSNSYKYLDFSAHWRNVATGEIITGDLPVGALYYSDWLSWRGEDGHSLTCVTPVAHWNIDHPSTPQNRPWKRTGTPPIVTATPSILFPSLGFHGWLTNGVLREC